MAEDRAHVGAVVVAVMQRLDDDDTEMKPESPVPEFGLDRVIRLDSLGRFDQLIPASDGVLFEGGNAGEVVALMELGFASAQPKEVALLSGKQVLKSRSDRSVSPRSAPFQLIVCQLRADVEELQISPLVVAKCFQP